MGSRASALVTSEFKEFRRSGKLSALMSTLTRLSQAASIFTIGRWLFSSKSEKNEDRCKTLVSSNTTLAPPLVEIVLHYLLIKNQMTPQALHRLYGREVADLYLSQESSLPPRLNQTLEGIFPFSSLEKVSEMTSLICIPMGVTPNLTRQWGARMGMEIEESPAVQRLFKKLGNEQGDADAWYLVSHAPISLMLDGADEIEGAMKKEEYEWASFRVLLFTLFSRHAWRGEPLIPYEPLIYLSFRESKSLHLAMGVQKNLKLAVVSDMLDVEHTGPVAMKRLA